MKLSKFLKELAIIKIKTFYHVQSCYIKKCRNDRYLLKSRIAYLLLKFLNKQKRELFLKKQIKLVARRTNKIQKFHFEFIWSELVENVNFYIANTSNILNRNS